MELHTHHGLSTLRPRRKGRHFANDIFKCISFRENVWILIFYLDFHCLYILFLFRISDTNVKSQSGGHACEQPNHARITTINTWLRPSDMFLRMRISVIKVLNHNVTLCCGIKDTQTSLCTSDQSAIGTPWCYVMLWPLHASQSQQVYLLQSRRVLRNMVDYGGRDIQRCFSLTLYCKP